MIGPRLKLERMRRNLTQDDVIAKTGLAVNTIRRLESKRNYPNSFSLFCYCQAIGISMDLAFKPLNNRELEFVEKTKYANEKYIDVINSLSNVV